MWRQEEKCDKRDKIYHTREMKYIINNIFFKGDKLRNHDNNFSDFIWALGAAIKDLIYEIKSLKKKHSELGAVKINLATSGVTACPNCGASFEESESKCGYCGYVSKERDEMLEKLREAQRKVEFQIKEEQSGLKTLVTILLSIVGLIAAVSLLIVFVFLAFSLLNSMIVIIGI